MSQRGSSMIIALIITFVLIGVGLFIYFTKYYSPEKELPSAPVVLNMPARPDEPPPTSMSVPTPRAKANKTSPSGLYIVEEDNYGDQQIIRVKNNENKIIIKDLLIENKDEIGYNIKYQCMCAISFGNWIDEENFNIYVVNGGGEEYEFVVNMSTAKVDESSFKRIK